MAEGKWRGQTLRIKFCGCHGAAILIWGVFVQAVVKAVAGFFHGTSKHLFGVTSFKSPTNTM
jgi:hypothetical protein